MTMRGEIKTADDREKKMLERECVPEGLEWGKAY